MDKRERAFIRRYTSRKAVECERESIRLKSRLTEVRNYIDRLLAMEGMVGGKNPLRALSELDSQLYELRSRVSDYSVVLISHSSAAVIANELLMPDPNDERMIPRVIV